MEFRLPSAPLVQTAHRDCGANATQPLAPLARTPHANYRNIVPVDTHPRPTSCPSIHVTGNKPAALAAVIVGFVLMVVVGCHTPGVGHNIEGVRDFQQGNAQAAVYRFQQAVAEAPTNPDAYYNLAACYHFLGKNRADNALLSQAENLYHQCLDLNADHIACHRALAVLLVDTNRPRSAFTLMERWVARSPHVADARIELARLHEEFGEASEARRYLAEAIDVNPGNSRAWAAMARLREAEGNLAQALNNYRRAYALNNAQPQVGQRIAALQQRVSGGFTPNAAGTRYATQPTDGWTRR